MNFAPTVDVYYKETSAVIGPRAFSSNPGQVSLFALAYYKGMDKAGIICVAKHFPGHGAADKDSHGFLPHIIADFDTLWEKDLLPYRMLIKEGLPAIMSGHLAFPRITGDVQPATLSPFFLQRVLRDKLGFQGVVITDDMEMWGAHGESYSIPQATAKALEAGNDLILVSHTPAIQEECWNYHMHLMKVNTTFRNRIKESVRRILQLKLSALKKNFPLLPNPISVEKELPLPEAQTFFFDSTCRSITVIKNKNIPYTPQPKEKILLIGQTENFFSVGKAQYPTAERYSYAFYPIEWSQPKDLAAVRQLAPRYNTVIFCLVSWNSLEVLAALKDYKGKLIVISSLSPIYLKEVPWVESALAVYSLEKVSFLAGFRALAGDFKPEGVLPIAFE
jgi:beta-N-acetylhexosaminidase